MQRRLLAAVAAFLIAVAGAVVLVSYTSSADARAQAGEQLVPVLVVVSPVPVGTAARSLTGSVTVEQVPTRLVAPGSVSDLSDISGQVSTAELWPGQQVLAAQFADPATLLPAGAVAAPEGTQEITLTLQPQQAVGGAVKGGDRVGVIVLATDDLGLTTSQTIDDVLVTRSTGDPSQPADPTTEVTVTLALDGPQSALVVNGMQDGTIWLTLQSIASSTTTSTGASA